MDEGNPQSVEEINTNCVELYMQMNDQVEDLLGKPKHNTLMGQVEDLLGRPKHEMLTDYQIPTNTIQMGQLEDLLAKPKYEVLTAEGCMVENHQIPKNKYQESLLYYPVFDNRLGYCDFPTIECYQSEDLSLQQSLTTDPRIFHKQVGNSSLICTNDTTGNWKIVLVDTLMLKIIRWYHEFLKHSEGAEKLYKTISRICVHPKFHTTCKEYVDNCDVCKRMKTGHQQEGQLVPRIAIAAPWEEVHVDCISNWRSDIIKSVVLNLCALTMIDPVTNLLEIVCLP